MISRRDFLKIAGITTASTGMVSLGLPNVLAEMPKHGRILKFSSDRNTAFLPDSVHEILGYRDGFVRLPAGYVPEYLIQPMLEAHMLQPVTLPAYVEVIAPYAAVRQYCAADALLMARSGHGAVFEAVKALDDAHGKFQWYQVDTGNGLMGWVQSTHVQQVIFSKTPANTHAVIQDHQMAVYCNEHELTRFALACPVNLPTGTHHIMKREYNLHTGAYKGVPWLLETNHGLKLSGTYWHNQFSCISSSSHVELSVIAAKALFTLLPAGSTIDVR